MAIWECAECTAQYSVGAPKCPQCGSTIRINDVANAPEEDQEMAKITVHGGPSNAAADDPEETEGVPETEPDSSETNEQPSPSRARTTSSRSKKARTADTDTATQDTE